MTTKQEAALRAEVKEASEGLAQTLEALAHEVQPAVQIAYLREDMRAKATSTVDEVREKLVECAGKAKQTLLAAKAGDPAAIKKTAIVAGAAIVTVLVLAVSRR